MELRGRIYNIVLYETPMTRWEGKKRTGEREKERTRRIVDEEEMNHTEAGGNVHKVCVLGIRGGRMAGQVCFVFFFFLSFLKCARVAIFPLVFFCFPSFFKGVHTVGDASVG